MEDGYSPRELDAMFVMQTYARKPVTFVRGQGMRLYDDTGKEYLDFLSGIGAVSMGHAHPTVTAAICEQARKLLHVSNLFYVENRGELAAAIDELLGFGWRTFFANSGAEANEGAIKLARKWAGTHKPGAYKVVSALRSFHGRTLATLAATGQPSKQAAFAPLPAGFLHVPLNDLSAMRAAIDDETVAVLLECIQGEGGVWPCDPEYLTGVRALCDETNTLLVLDEVQTGFFRTGTPFAFQGYDVEPDIVTMAKGMGNGVPIGAFSARDAVAVSFDRGDHGTTFGGSPLVCAASLATIQAMLDEEIEDNVAAVGAYFRGRLSEVSGVTGVRGRGLMLGVTLAHPVAQKVVDAALEKGLVFNAVGEYILRFLPPLVCTNDDVDTLMQELAYLIESAV